MKRFMNEIKRIFKRDAVTIMLVVAVLFMSISQTRLIKAMDNLDLNNNHWQEKYEAMADANEENIKLFEEVKAENDELKERVEELENQPEPEIDILKYAGELYDIDPKLLEAIERLESGNYTSNIYLTKNNTWGAYDSLNGVYYTFDSHEQSTMELARTLRYNYFNKGLDTLEEIEPIYCPDGNWAVQVREIYEQL